MSRNPEENESNFIKLLAEKLTNAKIIFQMDDGQVKWLQVLLPLFYYSGRTSKTEEQEERANESL